MGIRCYCPNGHKLNIKEFLAGRTGICPHCGVKFPIPKESTRAASKKRRGKRKPEEPAPQAISLADAPVAGPTAGNGPQTYPSTAVPADVSGPVSVQPAASEWDAPGPQMPTAAEGRAPGAVPANAAVPPSQPPQSETPDPLTEAGDVVWYVRPASGGQFGPANAEIMRTWISEGRVSADSLVWREGWRDWLEAAEVFPQLKAEPSPFAISGISPGTTSPSAAVSTEAAASTFSRPRRRSSSTQAVIITALILAVIVLAVVFVLVLTGALGGGEARATDGPATAVLVGSPPQRAVHGRFPVRPLTAFRPRAQSPEEADDENPAVSRTPRRGGQPLRG